jgi:protein-S-isoprenylcysteine O-methyltransferase Ste14
MAPSGLGLWLLVLGYFLVAFFILIERRLRRTPSAKTFERGDSDSGSTLLIGSTFGAGLLLPLILDVSGIGVYSITFDEGFLGLFVMLTGIGLRVWAATTLGKYYTRTLLMVEGQTVVAVGPYSKIRHPGYLGGILLWSGFGILSSNLLLAIIFPVIFVGTYLFRIRAEERMLDKALGSEYEQYKTRTHKLIPFVY